MVMALAMKAGSFPASFHMQALTSARTWMELNATHMGQPVKSGKELVEHPDQLLSGQGRREVGKSFDICEKNTKQRGRKEWGKGGLIFSSILGDTQTLF